MAWFLCSMPRIGSCAFHFALVQSVLTQCCATSFCYQLGLRACEAPLYETYLLLNRLFICLDPPGHTGLAEQRECFCLVFKAEYIIPYAACSLPEDSVVWR